MITATTISYVVFTLFALLVLSSVVVIVPQRKAFIVERLGKYLATLTPGLHFLIPFIDRVRYKHSLKEQAVDVNPQTCITKDNVSIEVDGVLYFQVVDPTKASYGIEDYRFASIQIAQTTMRSVVGRLELDKTFEERETINGSIVEAVDKASEPWGVKITRYEVKNITPPVSIREAMEKQMRAEREKRAIIAESEGTMQAKINVAEGDKQEAIKKSEGEKLKRINEAQGRASEIEALAIATGNGLKIIATAMDTPNGREAVSLRIAEQYLQEFGKLAQKNNTMILPANLTDLTGVLASARKVLEFSQPVVENGKTKN
ncbi:MAG: stomatin-like protein [Saprospiraceae bacterium]|nr:stomatin-like protein [Saprospiraceae bacterium]